MSGNFTATRTITYASGAIIYAANHNTNETTIYTAHNNAFNSSTGHQHTGATGDAPKLNSSSLDLTASYAWTGAHSFSDAVTTIEALSTKTNGFVNNVGCTLSSGRFKITAADGTVFSATNPGTVGITSTTSGKIVSISLTSDAYYFDDDSATSSDIVGNEFGLTSGVAFGDQRPFFIYAVNSDNTAAGIQFAISPDPTRRVTPSSSNDLGYKGVPAATPEDTNFFFLTSTDIRSSHTSKPCICIGTVLMTMSSSDDWTVATLDSTVGIGNFVNLTSEFDMSTGQNGAAAVKMFYDNGGTAPSFTSNYKRYRLRMDGIVEYNFAFQSGTNGAGAVQCRLALPYKALNPSAEGLWHGCGLINNSGATQNSCIIRVQEQQKYCYFLPTGGVTALNNSNFGAVDNNVFGSITYPAFGRVF